MAPAPATVEAEPASQHAVQFNESFEDALDAGLVTLSTLEAITTLGQGAFGIVKLVAHTPTGQVAALKAIKKAHVIAMNQRRQVAREASIFRDATARDAHLGGTTAAAAAAAGTVAAAAEAEEEALRESSFVARLFATFHDRDRLYMLMEFLQGGELYGLLYEEYSPITEGAGGMPFDAARFYVGCVAAALKVGAVARLALAAWVLGCCCCCCCCCRCCCRYRCRCHCRRRRRRRRRCCCCYC